MKKLFIITLFICFCVFGCAGKQAMMSKTFPGMSSNELKAIASTEGFSYQQKAIYKGYSLIKTNKRGVFPIFYILNPRNEVVSMEDFETGKDFSRQYLVDFVEDVIRFKGDIKIENK